MTPRHEDTRQYARAIAARDVEIADDFDADRPTDDDD
jgi:hypothetical protein